MAKKNKWKKSIRAEVAAALQTNPNQPNTHAAVISNKTQGTVKATSASTQALQINTSAELWRIFWVAFVLFGLLATATFFDYKKHWLDSVASSISSRLK